MPQNVNSHVLYQGHHQYRFSVNVWAGTVDKYPVGPYLLPSRLTDVYKVFRKEVLPQLLEDVPLPIHRRMWFQQYGALAHFSQSARQYLDNNYSNRWIES